MVLKGTDSAHFQLQMFLFWDSIRAVLYDSLLTAYEKPLYVKLDVLAPVSLRPPSLKAHFPLIGQLLEA